MSEKFKNKYRIPSARLQTWDYGSNGMYFITICTQNREHYFGDLIGGKIELSEIGILASKYWYEIPEHFPFVNLDEFVVMPNHVHGIIIIDKPINENNTGAQSANNIEPELVGGIAGNKNPMFHKNISRIIRWYKGRCSFEMRKIHACFTWQSRFHDHIIRSSESYEKIRNYIANNFQKWEEDKFYN